MSLKLIASKFLKGPDPSTRHFESFIITEDYKTFKHGIETGNFEEVQLAITNGVDVNLPISNSSIKDSEKHAIEIVCSRGYWRILDLLLTCPMLVYDFKKPDSLLCIVGKNLTKDRINETTSNYRNCFKRLLDDNRVDINLTDYLGNTPLHYSVEYKCDELIKLLLEHGAYIGIKNLKNKLPIDGMNYRILHDFLDSRMSSNYDCNNIICNDFEINLDYSFLIKKPNKYNVYSQNTDQFYPIEIISQSEHLKELISHPLIRYLIWMKSEALSLLFIWNINLFFAFLLTIVYITFFNLGVDEKFTNEHMFIYILTRSATWFCIIVVGFYLIVQAPIIIKDIKITSYGIWRFLIELSIVVLLLIVFNFQNTKIEYTDFKKQATAVCIILIAIDMNLLMITVPKFQKISVHFLMLQKISSQFLSVFLFYLIILFAFSLAFYVLDHQPSSDENDSILNNLNNLGQRFIRIIGMMIGELNLEFESSLIVYYIFILLFIFLITIVLINLLNGLAVSDVGEVKLSAKLIYLVYRVQLIVGYEKYFLKHVFMRKFIFNLMRYQNSLLCIKRLKITLNQYVKDVKIYPNRDVTMVNNISRPVDPDDNEVFEWPKVNKNIVNQLVEHFKKKLEEKHNSNREDELKKILNEINLKLDRMQMPMTPETNLQRVKLNPINRNLFV